MNEAINEVKALLEWYRINFGDQIYLNNDLIDEIVIEKSVPSPVIQQQKQLNKRKQENTKVIAQKSPELNSFYLEIKDCDKCALSATRKNFVFGYGNPHAKIMFIGEAPGQDEDEQGLPFVGRAGKLLDKMLAAINLKRDDVFIANVLKCRPPNNRDPLPEEIVKCEPYLHKQLEYIKPRILVALGRVSGSVLLREEKALREFREDTHIYNNIPLIVTYHPAALLRNPQWKRSAWIDFKKISGYLD